MRSILVLNLLTILAPALWSAVSVGIGKRDDNVLFTYYNVGLGVCGRFNQPTDFVVALNSPEWNSGTHCFETITMTANGKTTTAQIVDECPTCSVGGLDLSTGLFDFFAGSLDAGEITGSWEYTT